MLATEDVVDIENVVPVFIVGAVVVHWLARLGEDTTRVV
jgi:hypothetical protein